MQLDDLDVVPREKKNFAGRDMLNARFAIKSACDIQILVDGKRGPGWPNMSLETLTERETVVSGEWNLNEVDPCDKDV